MQSVGNSFYSEGSNPDIPTQSDMVSSNQQAAREKLQDLVHFDPSKQYLSSNMKCVSKGFVAQFALSSIAG